MNEQPDDHKEGDAASEAGSADIEQMEFKSNWQVLVFLFLLIKQNKKWWLLPLLFVLGFLGLFVSLTGNSSILPAIYAFF